MGERNAMARLPDRATKDAQGRAVENGMATARSLADWHADGNRVGPELAVHCLFRPQPLAVRCAALACESLPETTTLGCGDAIQGSWPIETSGWDCIFERTEIAAIVPPSLTARVYGTLFPNCRSQDEGSSGRGASGGERRPRDWAVAQPLVPDGGAHESRASWEASDRGDATAGSMGATACEGAASIEAMAPPGQPGQRATRILPPRDIVRIEDRLRYLLQPPLEQLMSARSLAFPFAPFGYQWDGIAYLFPRHEAVLADEMGLGKTMQTVATLRLLAHQGEIRRALLACPKPLVSNWQREFASWAPELPVTVVEGRQTDREWMWRHAVSGVLIANYEMLVRDREIVASLSQPFDLMVIDEAQRIKNRSGTTHAAACATPRRRSWALTGTPIENSVDDLVGIFEFVSPGRLRPQMKLSTLRHAVRDHVLRRTKDQVLMDLPPKLVRDTPIVLAPEQQTAYQLAENEGIVRLNDMGQEVTIRHVFELVLRLKQICNFDPVTGVSAKFDQLRADLEECVSSGRKAIVFSQWVGAVETLASRLAEFGPLQYHGKIPGNRRDAVIAQFRDDPASQLLLMSYGAGSVGLNLQFAQYVFLFDRWWNPAVEDQAINRAHRIGASGAVTVSRFLAVNTIEERIQSVLDAKRELFNAVFDLETSRRRRGLSRDDIFGLFNLRVPSAA